MSAVLSSDGRFRQALGIQLLSALAGSATRFVVSMVLARLLAPAELGLFAIAAALVGLVQMAGSLGMSAWLQREPELTEANWRSCLGLLHAGAIGALLFQWAMAFWAAAWFGQPALRDLILVLSLGQLVSPVSLAVAAWLHREYAAARLAAVARLGAVIHALTAILLAMAGWGALALAWAQVVNGVVCALAYWRLRPAAFSFRPDLHGHAGLLRFALPMLAGQSLAVMNQSLPALLLGRLGSPVLVGLLARAQGVVGLLHAVVGGAVNFGAFRRFSDIDLDVVTERLAHATALLTGLAWPVLAITAVLSEPLVVLFYGEAWRESTAAIPALALALAVSLLVNFIGPLLAAQGGPGRMAAAELVLLLARLVAVPLLFDGSLVSFAEALAGAALLALPLQLAWAVRQLGSAGHKLLQALLPSLLGATAAAAGAAGLAAWARPWGVGPAALLGLAGMALVLGAAHGPWRKELAQLGRLRITSRK